MLGTSQSNSPASAPVALHHHHRATERTGLEYSQYSPQGIASLRPPGQALVEQKASTPTLKCPVCKRCFKIRENYACHLRSHQDEERRRAQNTQIGTTTSIASSSGYATALTSALGSGASGSGATVSMSTREEIARLNNIVLPATAAHVFARPLAPRPPVLAKPEPLVAGSSQLMSPVKSESASHNGSYSEADDVARFLMSPPTSVDDKPRRRGDLPFGSPLHLQTVAAPVSTSGSIYVPPSPSNLRTTTATAIPRPMASFSTQTIVAPRFDASTNTPNKRHIGTTTHDGESSKQTKSTQASQPSGVAGVIKPSSPQQSSGIRRKIMAALLQRKLGPEAFGDSAVAGVGAALILPSSPTTHAPPVVESTTTPPSQRHAETLASFDGQVPLRRASMSLSELHQIPSGETLDTAEQFVGDGDHASGPADVLGSPLVDDVSVLTARSSVLLSPPGRAAARDTLHHQRALSPTASYARTEAGAQCTPVTYVECGSTAELGHSFGDLSGHVSWSDIMVQTLDDYVPSGDHHHHHHFTTVLHPTVYIDTGCGDGTIDDFTDVLSVGRDGAHYTA